MKIIQQRNICMSYWKRRNRNKYCIRY